MPQWRKLHVKTLESLDFNDLGDDFTRLTWCLLPLVACSEGRGLYHPAWLKSKLFPIRSDVTHDQLMSSFARMAEFDMIRVYTVNGRDYWQITKWHEHQGSNSREAASPYPGPEEAEECSEIEKLTNSGPTHELVTTSSGTDIDVDVDIEGDVDVDVDTSAAVAAEYAEFLKEWADLFPEKPQPRANNKTLQGKIKTRLKADHFYKNWRKALTRASKSKFLQSSSWFDAYWFLNNDANYDKCLSGKYDDTPMPRGKVKPRANGADNRLGNFGGAF